MYLNRVGLFKVGSRGRQTWNKLFPLIYFFKLKKTYEYILEYEKKYTLKNVISQL